jgi:P4 family phage/plasmid primase-like protien
VSSASERVRGQEPTFWAAPEVAKAGIPVFPISPRDKYPSVEGGFYSATTDPSEIAAWIEEGREHHNIAIPTGVLSQVVVIEADTPEMYAWMEERYGPPAVKTRRGGHWWFRHPRKGRVVSNAVREGLDRKGDGGYVLVPPSLGRTWTSGIPQVQQLPELPQEFWTKRAEPTDAPRSAPQERKEAAATAIAARVVRIAQGRRHEHLKHLCGVLLAREVPFGDAEDILIDAWTKVGGELAERAPREVTNTLRTTEQALAEGRATGVPKMEEITPGLYAELSEIMGWVVKVTFGGASRNGHGSPAAQGFNLTDLGNAERFVAHHGEDVRYCYQWRKWLVWTGARWERDEAGRVHRLAKETVRSIYREASNEEDENRRKALAKHARASESETRIRAMVELAKSEIPAAPDELDADPWLLNTAGGTIDLRTGKLREHRREDLITKLAPVEYDPEAEAPTWSAFLERVLPGEELRQFVRRAAGYSATGNTSEQCMFIHHGPGANGKSTFQEAVTAALGDYAMRTPTETLLVKRPGGVPNDIARLKGARLVTASETEEGRRLAESLVKDLTGQDTISARFMWAEWFDFKPTHALHLSTNHKPEIRGTDAAIWRRIRLIPWAVTIPPAEQDRELPEKLRAELPGVLAWIVRGCSEWQREGLQAPEEVRKATRAYRAEMDVLAAFLADCCVRDEDETAFAGELWGAWKRWCEETGEQFGTQKRFGGRLAERGFLNHRDSKTGRKVWSGLSLRPNWESRAGITLNHSNVRFAGNSERAEPSEPKNNKVLKDLSREETLCEKGSEGSEGSAPTSCDLKPGESATVEQLQRIRDLTGQGMREDIAREEVLGKGWVPE